MSVSSFWQRFLGMLAAMTVAPSIACSGGVDDLRIIHGHAAYTTGFTPPAAPLTP